jgi:hypothetical protein
MKTYQKILLTFVILLLGAGVYYYPKLQRVNQAMHLFDRDIIVDNFRTMNQMITFKEVKAPETIHSFPVNTAANPLPANFTYAGLTMDVPTYLDSSYTTGFLVLQDDTIVHEEYLRGHTAATPQIVWSVSKSFLSALLGIALV